MEMTDNGSFVAANCRDVVILRECDLKYLNDCGGSWSNHTTERIIIVIITIIIINICGYKSV